jgi:hypothetical protein
METDESPNEIESGLQTTTPEIDTEWNQRVVHISKIVASDLKKVELIGKNDVYVKLKTSNSFRFKTTTLQNAGANAEWNYDDTFHEVDFIVTPACLQQDMLHIKANNENVLIHSHIGEGTILLQILQHLDINQSIDIKVTLLDKWKNNAGIVVITMIIKDLDAFTSQPTSTPQYKSNSFPIAKRTIQHYFGSTDIVEDIDDKCKFLLYYFLRVLYN